tara:strand:+ start:345 stop:677 length:333 start_codon:yes stop_codon:yes gene_type:complete
MTYENLELKTNASTNEMMDQFIDFHIKRLPLHISSGIRDHISELQKRVPSTLKDTSDKLACVIISAKVLDDEYDYDMNFWTVPHTSFTLDEIKELELKFLTKINWRASFF